MTGKLSKTAWAAAMSSALLGLGGCSTTVQVVEKSVCDPACQKAMASSERLGVITALNQRAAAFEKTGDKGNARATTLLLTHYIRGTDPALNAALSEHIKRDTLTDEMLQKLATGVQFSTRVVPCGNAAVKSNQICVEARPAASGSGLSIGSN